ncbi:hypothetical protein JFV29_06900 [Peribacillus sp. TH16]|uniref:hypothetical protein n=1 Tax=Peribacillus sp. R9-11 TaxID=3073271 RepID=UPI001913E0C3|nr:hypothetical protein [Peribacillus sp. R9-11]MBK5481666.1 hypothetical protein [Peribacillus sp. TH16]WMX56844.1 hypothetical protein RE409_06365 [Peribacillus sp. R9-11]
MKNPTSFYQKRRLTVHSRIRNKQTFNIKWGIYKKRDTSLVIEKKYIEQDLKEIKAGK